MAPHPSYGHPLLKGRERCYICSLVRTVVKDKKLTISSPLGERMPIGQVRGCFFV